MWDLIGKVLPGISEMMNIHPMLVHFPIALLNAFVLMELLAYLLKKEEMKNAATWMLYLGTMGAAATVVAGFSAASSVPHNEEVHAIMTRHMYFGLTVFLLSLSLTTWRLTGFKKGSPVHLVIGFIMVTIMAFGADLGGLMVYKYGVAVKAVPQAESHDHSMGGHDHSTGENKEDDMDMGGMTLESLEKDRKQSPDNHDHGAHDH
ncbi:MAG: DUF2231 domain-containing protein [Deltaproteobacteria bacterium]|nr:DUF2231 domain-containing protein [Deltaproteobacteria bacterium]